MNSIKERLPDILDIYLGVKTVCASLTKRKSAENTRKNILMSVIFRMAEKNICEIGIKRQRARRIFYAGIAKEGN